MRFFKQNTKKTRIAELYEDSVAAVSALRASSTRMAKSVPYSGLRALVTPRILNPQLEENFNQIYHDNLGFGSVLIDEKKVASSKIVERSTINFEEDCKIELESQKSKTSKSNFSTSTSVTTNQLIDASSTKMYYEELRDSLKKCIMTTPTGVTFDQVAGNEYIKETIRESLIMPSKFPHLFNGKPKPWHKILLYGPPGVGKTMLLQAIANEVDATCFWVSVADVTSKYIGESERLLRLLFELAKEYAPSVIFIDEMDSIGRKRNGQESETERRIKTEFLRQMDEIKWDERVHVIATTNMPWELDIAALRRFERRLLIPLPGDSTREEIFKIHCGTTHSMDQEDFQTLAKVTEGYSGSDICNAINEAFMKPVRILQKTTHFKLVHKQNQFKFDGSEDGPDNNLYWSPCEPDDPQAVKKSLSQIDPSQLLLPSVTFDDCKSAMKNSKPTVHHTFTDLYNKFMAKYGHDDQRRSIAHSGALRTPSNHLAYFC
eukprot:CAMPEP_0114988938 /NCGR_PEP_ID=MMETSP0216-20121206/9901_1 /TAXON_ID=223996 /ORGANISM="Protocruzia adherens, Strain Boccale" /LENGTH=489 /DNA_ID=CAMNT_0002351823 /DNA_START=213 /DNA_END=1682 /DNA_ORIENTATION=+